MDKLNDLLTRNFDTFKYLGLAVCLYLILVALRKPISKIVSRIAHRFTQKTKNDFDDKMLLSFKMPLKYIYLSVSFWISSSYLSIKMPKASAVYMGLINNIVGTIMVVCVAWGFYNLTLEKSILFDKLKEQFGIKVDRILFPFISKCVRVLIIAFAIIIVCTFWGINVNGFITGLGLGGLAFSLAAKDAAANIIAGIILIMEKPFNIGDWICAGNVEGVVEDISFRSTKVRTFAQEIVIVPNSDIANTSITNFSRRGKRRITFNLGVTYNTPKNKIDSCINKIESMLRNNDQVHKETIFVTFDKFNDSSLDIFIYFFTITTDWGKYLKVKQEINFNILEILEEEGVSCAFPSTSIYLETPIKHEKQIDIFDDNSIYEDDLKKEIF